MSVCSALWSLGCTDGLIIGPQTYQGHDDPAASPPLALQPSAAILNLAKSYKIQYGWAQGTGRVTTRISHSTSMSVPQHPNILWYTFGNPWHRWIFETWDPPLCIGYFSLTCLPVQATLFLQLQLWSWGSWWTMESGFERQVPVKILRRQVIFSRPSFVFSGYWLFVQSAPSLTFHLHGPDLRDMRTEWCGPTPYFSFNILKLCSQLWH